MARPFPRMRPLRRWRLQLILTAGVAIIILALPLIFGPRPMIEKPLIELVVCPRSRSAPSVDAIVRKLNLQPGMRVLDVGNADPHLALAMAQEVGEKGSVVAADFEERRTNKAVRMASKRGLQNFAAATITPKWDEDFYRGRQFDVVVLDDVFDRLPDPHVQLAGLRQTLSGRTARVFVLRAEFLIPFDESMHLNSKGVIDVLRKLGKQSPFYDRLHEGLKSLVDTAEPPMEIDAATHRRVIEFLNACLADQGLFMDVDRYYARETHIPNEYMKQISPDIEVHLLQYLFHNFGRIFDKGAVPINPQEKLAVYTVNHILLTSIFSLPKDCPLYSELSFYNPDVLLEDAFGAAGYLTVARHELSPQYHMWEFKGGAK